MSTVEHSPVDEKPRLPAALLKVVEDQHSYDPVPTYPPYLWAKWFVSIIEGYGVCHDAEEANLLNAIHDLALTGQRRCEKRQ